MAPVPVCKTQPWTALYLSDIIINDFFYITLWGNDTPNFTDEAERGKRIQGFTIIG